MSGRFLVFFAFLWTVIVLLFDCVMGQNLWRQFESSHYPFTMGEITRSEMTTRQLTDNYGNPTNTTYGVDFGYNYVVNDRHFFGTRYRYNFGFSDYTWSKNAVAEHPVHSQAKVYFNPNNPEDSLLSPDLDGGDLMLLLLLLPFNLVMAGLWTAAGPLLKQWVFHPVAGGVKIIIDGPRTHIRLPQYSALLWGMAATGALSFILIFVLGFSTHMHPPMGSVCSVLLLVIAAGAGVYLWQWRKIHSGDDDLILDEAFQTVGLPETHGRKLRLTVERSQIDRLTVETIAHTGSSGRGANTYAPTLWLRRNGTVETEKLSDWSDRKRAEAFVEWLGQRLNLPGAVEGVAKVSL